MPIPGSGGAARLPLLLYRLLSVTIELALPSPTTPPPPLPSSDIMLPLALARTGDAKPLAVHALVGVTGSLGMALVLPPSNKLLLIP